MANILHTADENKFLTSQILHATSTAMH